MAQRAREQGRQTVVGLGQEVAAEPARESGPRPAQRFYEPLPLGVEAFAAPLAPIESEPPRPMLRTFGLIMGCAALLALSAVGVAFWLKAAAHDKGAEPAASASPAASSEPAEPAALPPAVRPSGRDERPAQAAKPKLELPSTLPITEARSAPVQARAPVPVSAATAVHEAQSAVSSEPASTRQKSAHHSASTKKPGLPERPDRTQVIAAMQAVQPAVRACLGASRDTATATLKVLGRTGRIATAQVTGLPGTIGSCLARAVRQARFPQFEAESLTISYPLHR